jgi:hypothetical protein
MTACEYHQYLKIIQNFMCAVVRAGRRHKRSQSMGKSIEKLTVQYCTTQCSAILYFAVQYSVLLCSIAV